jgi:hypothetical protein
VGRALGRVVPVQYCFRRRGGTNTNYSYNFPMCVLEDCIRFDLRGLSHTPPTFRGPDLGHLLISALVASLVSP